MGQVKKKKKNEVLTHSSSGSYFRFNKQMRTCGWHGHWMGNEQCRSICPLAKMKGARHEWAHQPPTRSPIYCVSENHHRRPIEFDFYGLTYVDKSALGEIFFQLNWMPPVNHTFFGCPPFEGVSDIILHFSPFCKKYRFSYSFSYEIESAFSFPRFPFVFVF